MKWIKTFHACLVPCLDRLCNLLVLIVLCPTLLVQALWLFIDRWLFFVNTVTLGASDFGKVPKYVPSTSLKIKICFHSVNFFHNTFFSYLSNNLYMKHPHCCNTQMCNTVFNDTQLTLLYTFIFLYSWWCPILDVMSTGLYPTAATILMK